MSELFRIKRHVDGHGIGCAIRGDHVAIGLLWTSRALDGRLRHIETTARVRTIDEAIAAVGCGCAPATIPPAPAAPGEMAA